MKILLLFAALGLVTAATEGLQVFGYTWSVPQASDWKIGKEDGADILQLATARGPVPGPRRPIQFALADTRAYRDVTIDADIRPLKRSVILVFAYRDPAHFDYAHLSTDTGEKQPVHNGIFHVFGGERVRISNQGGPAAFPELNRWYHVRLTYKGEAGDVSVSVDNRTIPALHAIDLSLAGGKVGLGSFDETGDFRNVKISGVLDSF